jgi:phosphopantetheinyl transferase
LVLEIDKNIDELKNQLTDYNKTDFEKISSEKRKKEFLGIRIALKELLNYEAQIIYDETGKPFLSDNSYNISISHSGKWVAVIAHPTRNVGIDIEVCSTKIQKVFTRFLSKTEQTELSNGTNIEQLQLAWSAKESLYKIIGNQAVDFAKSLRVFPFDITDKGTIIAQHIPTKTLYKLSYIHNSTYSLVYCIA